MGKITKYLIGITIFMFFMVGGTTLIMELKSSDSSFASDSEFNSFNDTFNKYDDLTTQVDETKAGITDAKPSFGVFGALNALVETGWQTLKTLFASFDFMNDVFDGLSSYFGIPTYVPGIIIAIVTIVLVFAILSAIFQRDI